MASILLPSQELDLLLSILYILQPNSRAVFKVSPLEQTQPIDVSDSLLHRSAVSISGLRLLGNLSARSPYKDQCLDDA